MELPRRGVSERLTSTLMLGLLFALLVACDTQSQPTIQPSQGDALDTTPTLLPARATGEALDRMKRDYVDHQFDQKDTMVAATTTALALTPTRPPLSPTLTRTLPPPLPTPTLVMGMIECASTTAGTPYIEYSCWRGIVNGQLMDVSSGRERLNSFNEDPQQGFVLIYTTTSHQLYRTPSRVGGVKIVSVSGTQLNLTTYGRAVTPAIFTFDLATRQFVGANGMPIPTTPVPGP